MKKRILSIVTALALCLGLTPAPAWAAEIEDTPAPQAGSSIRTELLYLHRMPEATENAEEGWKWEPDTNTLTLTNCHIKTDVTRFIEFYDSNSTPSHSEGHLILNGENVIECGSGFQGIIASQYGQLELLTVSGSGSLTVKAASGSGADKPYLFGGKSITIKDEVSIRLNVNICTISGDFTMNGGTIIAKGEHVDNGMYLYKGDAVINDGYLEIDAATTGIYLPGIPPTSRTNNVKISGGTVKIKAGVSPIYSASAANQTDATDNLEITGGTVELTGYPRVRKITVGEAAQLSVTSSSIALPIWSGFNIGATLAGGTYTGSTAAVKIRDGVDLTLADLLAEGYAFYQGSVSQKNLVADTSGTTLTGTIVVAKCVHLPLASNNDGTHGGKCTACGKEFTSESCDYSYASTAENHTGTCKVCGYEADPEEHRLGGPAPETNGLTTTIKSTCSDCGYTKILGTVKQAAAEVTTTYGKPAKLSVTASFPGYDCTYAWSKDGSSVGGAVENSYTAEGLNAGDYTYTCTVTVMDGEGNTVAEHTVNFALTVNKATLTGTPKYTAVSGSGKTLADAALTAPDGWPAGTLSWEKGDSEEVTVNTAYKWTFTPSDSANYNTLNGSITPWRRSTGGGGGGGGSYTPPVTTGTTTGGGVPTTQTTAVPSASTSGGKATAAVDTSMGNEIVKQAVANKSEAVVIAPTLPGSITKTEVSIPAATVGQIGAQTSADLTVSTSVADVTIPSGGLGSLSSAGGTVTVSAEKTGNTVELSVTAGGQAIGSVPGGLTLTVPTEHAAPGTVAVLVNSDGTREVVRKSVVKDGGLVIPLDGSAKLEIVDNSGQFDDVPAGGWEADAAAFASAHELFSGTAPRQFSPSQPMSRGMLAVVFHNLEHNPAQALTDVFADVSGSEWYARGVAWAAAQGIVNGYGSGQFGPGDSVTREQLAVMLWRYAGSPAAADQALDFVDADQASGWALEALRWAAGNGVIRGRGSGVLDPKGYTTRVEAAQIIKNFMEL